MTANIDDKLIDQARSKLYTAVLSDTLDAFGFHEQATHPSIRPLDDTLVLCGRARTGLYMEIHHDDPAVNIYEKEIDLVDDLKPGDVAVFACSGNLRIAPWGELSSTAAHTCGASGCVTDGLVRDVRSIRAMGFPVYSDGIGPFDTRHRGMMMKPMSRRASVGSRSKAAIWSSGMSTVWSSFQKKSQQTSSPRPWKRSRLKT